MFNAKISTSRTLFKNNLSLLSVWVNHVNNTYNSKFTEPAGIRIPFFIRTVVESLPVHWMS